MPNKGSPRGKSGPRRVSAKSHTRHQAPTNESNKESGPPRLYIPKVSTSATSAKESGPRRLYTSPGVQQHLRVPATRTVR